MPPVALKKALLLVVVKPRLGETLFNTAMAIGLPVAPIEPLLAVKFSDPAVIVEAVVSIKEPAFNVTGTLFTPKLVAALTEALETVLLPRTREPPLPMPAANAVACAFEKLKMPLPAVPPKVIATAVEGTIVTTPVVTKSDPEMGVFTEFAVISTLPDPDVMVPAWVYCPDPTLIDTPPLLPLVLIPPTVTLVDVLPFVKVNPLGAVIPLPPTFAIAFVAPLRFKAPAVSVAANVPGTVSAPV
jgi:hypothetical protein